MTKTNREARDDEREALARYPEDHKTIGGNASQRRAFLAGVEYARKHPEPEITEEFITWADRSPAVTWTGKLGLKERWANRNNPDYQEMLRRDYGE